MLTSFQKQHMLKLMFINAFLDTVYCNNYNIVEYYYHLK